MRHAGREEADAAVGAPHHRLRGPASLGSRPKGSSPIPKQEYPPLRVVYFSGKALTEGVETHVIQNVPVRVYSVAKTIADSNTEVVVRYQHCSIQPEFWLQSAGSMCCLYGLKGL